MKHQEATHIFDLAQIKLIVGLGNPGPRFAKTRHNAGFMLVDKLFEHYGAGSSWNTKSDAHVATISVPLKDKTLHSITLIKPMMFMNVSGVQIKPFLKSGITSEQVVVCYDELEKPFGKNMIRFGGSARGHNGVRSAIEQIGQNFWQLRIGIGRPEERSHVGDYVLENFSPTELGQIDESLSSAITLLSL